MKKTDILTLKKQVIEEIKSDLQLNGALRSGSSNKEISRPTYIDPFRRLEAQNPDSILLRGSQKNQQEEDDDLIVVNSRKPKVLEDK